MADLCPLSKQGFAAIIEPFCNGPKTEVALINTVQVYCYEDTRIIKAFPQVLKVSIPDRYSNRCRLTNLLSEQVLYNKDCISDQAIIYWHQKGSKPQGRQHFLQAAQPLVKVCSFFVPRGLCLTWTTFSFCKSRRVMRRMRSEGYCVVYILAHCMYMYLLPSSKRLSTLGRPPRHHDSQRLRTKAMDRRQSEQRGRIKWQNER